MEPQKKLDIKFARREPSDNKTNNVERDTSVKGSPAKASGIKTEDTFADKMIRWIVSIGSGALFLNLTYIMLNIGDYGRYMLTAAMVFIFTIWSFWWARSETGIYGILADELHKLEFVEDSQSDISPKEYKTEEQFFILRDIAIKAVLRYWVTSLVMIYFVMGTVWATVTYGIALGIVLALMAVVTVYYVYIKLVEFFYNNTKEIKADPPEMGVMTLFGRPLKILISPGQAFVFKNIIGFIPISTARIPYDFDGDIEGFYSKEDNPVVIKNASAVFSVDKTFVLDFINMGKQGGVEDALEDLVPNELRPLIREEAFDNLLGKAVPGGAPFDKHKLEDQVLCALTGRTKEHISRNRAEIMKEMQKTGIRDNMRYGIKLHKFTVGSIDTTQEFMEARLLLAKEERERKGETYEIDTELEQAQHIFDRYEKLHIPITFDECLKMVKDDKLVREGHRVIPGLRSNLSKEGQGGGGLASMIALFGESFGAGIGKGMSGAGNRSDNTGGNKRKVKKRGKKNKRKDEDDGSDE